MSCPPIKKKCSIPEKQTNCIREYYNRLDKQGTDFILWVKIKIDEKTEKNQNYSFAGILKYADDMDKPDCDSKTGKFKLKQCGGKK